jgi:hypothetical protein
VIVDDFHIVRIAVTPSKANPPPVVDTDAELTRPVPYKFFKPIPWYRSQVIKRFGRVQHQQFAECRTLN